VSDHYPAEIHIGGPIPQIVLTELIRVIVDEAVSLDGYGGPDVTEEALWKAFRQGAIVALYADQARFGQFDSLEAFLVKHRLHFDRHSEAFCEYNAEVVSYRGDEKAIALPADQSGHVMLRWEEVVCILDDNLLKNRAKLDAIRHLVAQPGTEPLSPIRFI
jgi:hypothetical protein